MCVGTRILIRAYLVYCEALRVTLLAMQHTNNKLVLTRLRQQRYRDRIRATFPFLKC